MPSIDGTIELRLGLLLTYGYATDDGQRIKRNAKKADFYLRCAAEKTRQNLAARILERKARFKPSEHYSPIEVKNWLHWIQLNIPKKGEIKNLLDYISTLQKPEDLADLLGLLVMSDVNYLPTEIFSALSQKVIQVNEKSNKAFEKQFEFCSPLVECLFYPKSLLLSIYDCPHAEFNAYRLYKYGGVTAHDKIGATGEKVTVQRNEHQALLFLQRAADSGHAEAQFQLGQMFLRQRKEFYGLKYLSLACSQYHEGAIFTLADYYWQQFLSNNNKNLSQGKTALKLYRSLGDCLTTEQYEQKVNLVTRAQALKQQQIARKVAFTTLFAEDYNEQPAEINEYSHLLDYELSPSRRRY